MARVIAFYLPQFHPIPENDKWWGAGFTEWTNVTKARPLFRGHEQPRLPADLGFYDLRVPEVREQQANLAREAGIEGFCYWHYWFGNGRRALERVFSDVVESGKPDFPFCLAWANESWTGRWHGLDSDVIIEQTYPGICDYVNHFYSLLPAFKDSRYMEVGGRKLFIIYLHHFVPDLETFARCWNDLAIKNGMNGFYFISFTRINDNLHERHPSLDGVILNDFYEIMMQTAANPMIRFSPYIKRYFGLNPRRFFVDSLFAPLRVRYADFVDACIAKPLKEDVFPCVYPNWDNTPRCKKRGQVLLKSTPELFKRLVETEIKKISMRTFSERIIFIKSWNEWAEGNYLEPDMAFGRKYLDALKKSIYMQVNKP